MGLIGCGALWALAPWGPSVRPLLLIILFVGGCNAVYLAAGRRLESTRGDDPRPFEIFAHVQITLDLLALFLLIFFTGGLVSPLFFFVIFHVVLAGILLSPLSCYTYTTAIGLAGAGLIGLHRAGLVPEWTAGGRLFFQTFEFPGIYISYAAFAVGLFIAAYLITSVKATLRSKGRDLMKVSHELEKSNAKLTSLYEMIKEIGGIRTRQDLMNAAVRQAARIMGVKACSIKLLDERNWCLRFAATYGLSGDYLSRDCISIDESAVNRRILEGSYYAIGRIDDANAFQYPENVRLEGIASMLCLPLKVDEKILGVFCVYSGEPDYFIESDVDFFHLVTELTALAMENVFREAMRTWFLNKCAHQLRSPLNTISSMIKVLEGRYQGPLCPAQMETVTRCLVRLESLQETINDLLTLAAGRQETSLPDTATVDSADLLKDLGPAYKIQAARKGVDLAFSMTADRLPVLGRKKMLEDVFVNLLSNAVKYTPAGGRVSVRLFPNDCGAVVLEVEDTGIGISQEDLPRLFSEFFRSEKAKAVVSEGTGLGLAIVKETMNALGGEVGVESEPGRGTLVRCTFPAAQSGERL